MTRRRLPIGIQTFRELRERDCYYADKTGYILRLVDEGKHYFLLFEGSEPLFAGLAIHGHWDWSVRRPVLRLSFGSGTFRTEGDLPAEVADQLEASEKAAGIAPRPGAAAARFRALIRALHERAGRRVVVLVDEYDKPILDTLEVSEVARANRDFLRGLYAVVKDRDAHVRFTFLTGEPLAKLSGCDSVVSPACERTVVGATKAWDARIPRFGTARWEHGWVTGACRAPSIAWAGAGRVAYVTRRRSWSAVSASTPNMQWHITLEAPRTRTWRPPNSSLRRPLTRSPAVRSL